MRLRMTRRFPSGAPGHARARHGCLPVTHRQHTALQVSVGSQQHRSRLAPLAASGIAKWQQDFAFAVVLPLKTRPLVLELHASKGGRRKGRTLARAYIPLADLFPTSKSECEPLCQQEP